MAAYLVSYDLNKAGKDYEALYERLRGYGTFLHMMDSVWVVVSNSTATQVSTHLRGVMDSDDHIFVVDITGRAHQGWLPRKAWDWINDCV